MNAPTSTGGPLPEIVLPDLEGRLVALSNYHERKLLIVMWASW